MASGIDIGITSESEVGIVAPQTAAERLAAVTAERDRVRKSVRQHAAGFDDESDFDAWELLEKLRKATLSLRQEEKHAPYPDLAPAA